MSDSDSDREIDTEKAQAKAAIAKELQTKISSKLKTLVCNQELFQKHFHIKKAHLQLTKEEKEAREKWNTAREQFISRYHSRVRDIDSATRCIDYSPVLPPPYDPDPKGASQRSKATETRSKRIYPETIVEWENFSQLLDTMETQVILPPNRLSPMSASVFYTTMVSKESSEEGFMAACVFDPLRSAGVIVENFQLKGKRQITIGKPDKATFHVVNGRGSDSVAIKTNVLEAKSLQNMLLPNDFNDLKAKYEAAVRAQKEKPIGRVKDWAQICHPLGQEFAYMIDNGVRYGALFCASKAYFIHFSGEGHVVENVQITRAYVAGQDNFVRAWACFFLAVKKELQEAHVTPEQVNAITPLQFSKEQWISETPIKGQPKEDGDGDDGNEDDGNNDDSEEDGDYHDSSGGGGTAQDGSAKRRPNNSKSNKSSRSTKKAKTASGNQTKKNCNKAESGADPPELASSGSDRSHPGHTTTTEVPCTPSESSQGSPFTRFDFETDFLEAVDFQDLKIGQRLGEGRNGDVFESSYKGEPVAVKQFDLSKNFDSYESEVKAYKHLKNAWGELVPTPMFISESPSGQVRFLGLQKGNPVEEMDDDWVGVQHNRVIGKLQSKYNFELLDFSECHNVVVVTGDHGQKKLLVIDLEFWGKPSET